MGDRANIYLEMPAKNNTVSGVYLYTHWSGYEWPEMLRQALAFGRDRWEDSQYLARIVTTYVFQDIVDSTAGGGLSLIIGDNSHPIIIADLINKQVSFAVEGKETDSTQRYGHMSFADYVKQESADYAKTPGGMW